MLNNKTQISWSIFCLCWFKYVRLNIDKMMTKQVGLDTNSPRQSKALPGRYCPRLYKSADVLGTSCGSFKMFKKFMRECQAGLLERISDLWILGTKAQLSIWIDARRKGR